MCKNPPLSKNILKDFYFIANWKMKISPLNKKHLENLYSLLTEQTPPERSSSEPNKVAKVILCPPAIAIEKIGDKIADVMPKYPSHSGSGSGSDSGSDSSSNKYIYLGAQDTSAETETARTGEISAPMLRQSQVTHCLIGHSERRQHQAETNEKVAAKYLLCLKNNMVPIICIGEPAEHSRQNNRKNYLCQQLDNTFNRKWLEYTKSNPQSNIIIAYEPIWSIGSGIIPKIKEIEQITSEIKLYFKQLFSKISAENHNKQQSSKMTATVLYGGSVNKGNVKELSRVANLDGVLVGGASHPAESFCELIKAAELTRN